MSIDYGTNNVNTSGIITATSGNFSVLQVNATGVSISGHTHLSSNITNFNSSVSGLVSGVYAPLSGKLNQFASTSSSELFGVISDETGSGLLVFHNSPTLTGVPLAPTAASGTNTNQIASTAFVRTEISNLVASAPSTLDTLNELATALGNDANFSTTVTNNLAGKANLSGASFTGNVSAPTGNFTVLQQNGTAVSTVGHSHTSSNITDFNSSVSGLVSGVYVPVTRTITPGSGLVGSSGLDLGADRTLHVGQGDGLTVSADAVAVNNTVIRTTGDQVLTGDKQFRTPLYAVSGIVINGYVTWPTRYGNQLDIAYQLDNGFYLAQFNTSSNVNLNSINLNAVTTFNKVSSDGALPFVISPTGYAGSGAVTQGFWRGSTLEVDKGGTGRSTYSNGQLLIGSGTSIAANTLSAGTGINITNGSGSITITASSFGNITNSGTIGTISGRPLITTTNGVVTTGVFGSTAGTFCQGNDSRLSDSRDPNSHTQLSSTIYENIGSNFNFSLLDPIVNNLGEGGSWDTVRGNILGAAATVHSHGNISSSGTVGSTSGLAVVTTSNGTITTSSNLSFDSNSLSINARYTEKVVPASIVSSGVTLNLTSGNLFTTTLNSNITGVTISNPPSSSNTSIGFSWILTADGTARTITWPSAVRWPGGTGPTLTATSGKIDVLSFLSTNNGTSYLGFIGGQNY